MASLLLNVGEDEFTTVEIHARLIQQLHVLKTDVAKTGDKVEETLFQVVDLSGLAQRLLALTSRAEGLPTAFDPGKFAIRTFSDDQWRLFLCLCLLPLCFAPPER